VRWLCCVALLAPGSWGAGPAVAGEPAPEEPLSVVIDLVDGSRLVGQPSIAALPLATSFGKVEVRLDRIRVVTRLPNREDILIELSNNDRITGALELDQFELRTLLGPIRIGQAHWQRLTVPAGGRVAGLVLWNRLDSEAAVRLSAVGPGGEFAGGRFVEGKFGQALLLRVDQPGMVRFPKVDLPGDAGCLEFWAQLYDLPAQLPWRQNPALVRVIDDAGVDILLVHLNGNDGTGNGGLCGVVGGLGYTGTAEFGSWTYARALGGAAVGWHHYALVWNKDGIEGVGDGSRRLAVFLDGKPTSGRWAPWHSGAVDWSGRTVKLLFVHDLRQGSVALDNLKIWSTPKTDFSDRSQE